MTLTTDDEDFSVELDDAAVKELETAYGIQPAAAAQAEAPKEKAKAVAKDDAAPVKAASADADLLRRLQAAETRAAEERAKRIDAERLAHDRGTTVAISKAQAAESDYHAVSNALVEATSRIDALKAAHLAALESGDYGKATDAAEKLAEVKAKQIQLTEGKAALEDRVRAARAAAETQSKSEAPKSDAAGDPMDQFFAATGMPPKAQAWFRAHPECAPVNDKANYYRALAAHESIIKSGVAGGSDEYFAKLDQQMGYAVSDEQTADTKIERDAGELSDAVVIDKPAKTAPKRVAAPVARDSVMQRRADGKVTLRLTAEQARMADEIGMSRTNYAKYLLKAETEGRLGRHEL